MAEADIIDGKAIAAELRRRVAESAALLREMHGLVPGLATIVVGDNPASHSYVRAKAGACGAAGLAAFERRLPADTGEAALVGEIARLNTDDRVDGILVHFAKRENPLQLINPVAPLPYTSMDNVVLDPISQEVTGWKLFSISF